MNYPWKTIDEVARFPAQWERHQATVMAYPFDEKDEMWGGALAEVRAEYENLMRIIAQSERILLLVANDHQDEIVSRIEKLEFREQIDCLVCPLDDIWLRDSGPLLLEDRAGRVRALCFTFNAWGEKYPYSRDAEVASAVASHLDVPSVRVPFVLEGGSFDFNGSGVALTTRECLLEKKRNPRLSEATLHLYLKRFFSLNELVWLNEGLVGDHTDGHVDTIARFVDPKTVVCHTTTDVSHPSYGRLQENFEQLRRIAEDPAVPFERVVQLPLPSQVRMLNGVPLALSYANFYFCNAALIVPQFDDPRDVDALKVLKDLVEDRPVIGLSAKHIVTGGGVFNCLTQQVPENRRVKGVNE